MEIALQAPKNNALAKSVALPVEHGSWGFLLEPLVAGILLAPSIASPWITMLVVGGFLLRQPLRFLIPDLMAKKNLPRTAYAKKITIIFASIFLTGGIGVLAFAPLQSLIPFVLITPFAV